MPRAKKHVQPTSASPTLDTHAQIYTDTVSLVFVKKTTCKVSHGWFKPRSVGSCFEKLTEQFMGTGLSPHDAKRDCMQKVITHCTLKLNAPIQDDHERRTIEENLLWATQRKAALERGISVTYQYPTDHHDWQKCFQLYVSSMENCSISCIYHPPMPFIGFGRSPQEAKANACAFLIRACTLKLRHMVEDQNRSLEKLKMYIDRLSIQLSMERSELDVFTLVKAIRDPKEAWSEAPKPVVSEPMKVSS